MAIEWAREHWPQRGATFADIQGSSITRHWKVKTDSKWDDSVAIRDYFRDQLGITYLSRHPNPNAQQFTMRSLDPSPIDETPTGWEVTATYSSAPLSEDEERQQNPNPLLRPTEIEWTSEMNQEFTTEDKDGKPMLNSAGDALEPIEKDDVRWVIMLTKNFQQLPLWVTDYVNKVNNKTIQVQGKDLPIRSCKLNGLRIGTLQNENDVDFYPITAEIGYRKSLWRVKRLDEGFHYLDAGLRKKITLDDGEDPSEPVPLDGSGGILASPTVDNAVYLTKDIYEEADLTELPF